MAHPILHMQRTIGNRATQRSLRVGAAHPLHSLTPAVRHAIAFADRQYQPLLRQSSTPSVQRELQPGEQAERMAACMQQREEILPPRVGLLTHIYRVQQLEAILGAEYEPLKRQILGSREARTFVCEAGVPAVIALADTRTEGRLDVAAARQALSQNRERYTHQALERRPSEQRITQARGALGEMGQWARLEARRPGIPSETGIVGLPQPQHESVDRVIARLQSSLPGLEEAARSSGSALPHLEAVIRHLNTARSRAGGEYGPMQARVALGEASLAAEGARDALRALAYRYDVDEPANRAEQLRASISELRRTTTQGTDVDTDSIRELRENARRLVADVRQVQGRLQATPDSVRRILFVLRYFKALNTPNFAGAPNAGEVALHRGHLGDIDQDLERVFGGRGFMEPGFDFIRAVAARIDRQLAVRAEMQQALGREQALVPPQQDVEEYFRSLAQQPNDAVIGAYERFAGAYFEHRGVSSREDLNVTGLEQIFSRPLSITGTRGLVCTGYAILGARLLQLTGAQIVNYIIAVRANDEQLVSANELDDAHALARLTRRGQTLFVSNDSIVFSQNDGIGPDAVAWARRDNPVYTATGTTVERANAALERRLSQEIPRARRRLNQ